ncbi:MAG: uracil-DNA glycosylase [Puniceicoccaceae bacterium]
MKRELAAVYDELVRRQEGGEESIYLSDEVVELLRAANAEAAKDAAKAPPSEAPQASPQKPVPARRKQKPVIEVPEAPVVELPEGDKGSRWAALREQVLADPWCNSQVKPGKQVVFGVGSIEARIFFCGEAPGADEEIQGEPFVGPAGQLLTKIIKAMGLGREEVYIANIMNYRPPMPTPVGNRAPELNEMAYCLPYLKAQLEIVAPEVIVALGNTAMEGLMGHDPKRRITKIRGQWMEFNGIPLLPTFHPSYLLRNQSMSTKRLVWEDMLAVMEKLEMPVTEKQRGYFK